MTQFEPGGDLERIMRILDEGEENQKLFRVASTRSRVMHRNFFQPVRPVGNRNLNIPVSSIVEHCPIQTHLINIDISTTIENPWVKVHLVLQRLLIL